MTNASPDPGQETQAVPDSQPIADLSIAPLPTDKTLERRHSLPFQAGRFAVFNARIMRMVLRGDH